MDSRGATVEQDANTSTRQRGKRVLFILLIFIWQKEACYRRAVIFRSFLNARGSRIACKDKTGIRPYTLIALDPKREIMLQKKWRVGLRVTRRPRRNRRIFYAVCRRRRR